MLGFLPEGGFISRNYFQELSPQFMLTFEGKCYSAATLSLRTHCHWPMTGHPRLMGCTLIIMGVCASIVVHPISWQKDASCGSRGTTVNCGTAISRKVSITFAKGKQVMPGSPFPPR